MKYGLVLFYPEPVMLWQPCVCAWRYSWTPSAAAVDRFCLPWLLDPFCFLPACLLSVTASVCSVIAACVPLFAASIADDAVPVGDRVFAADLVHCCSFWFISRCLLRPVLLALAPPTPCTPLGGGLRPKALWSEA
jgi:hypothetical protein